MKNIRYLNGLTAAATVAAWAFTSLPGAALADDSRPYSAFLSAVWAGDVAGARRHLAGGADPGAIDSSGLNAVQIAETLGDSAMLLLLGGNVESPAVARRPLEVAALPDADGATPFDLTFSPATLAGDPVFERVRRPGRDALAETAAEVRAERARLEAALPEPNAARTQDSTEPVPAAAETETSVAERVFGWFFDIFEPGPPADSVRSAPQDAERGRAVAARARDDDNHGGWTAATANAAETEAIETKNQGVGWLAALLDWGSDTAQSSPARRDEKFAGHDTSTTGGVAGESWSAVSVTRGARRRDGDAVATATFELADLTPRTAEPSAVSKPAVEWEDTPEATSEPAVAATQTLPKPVNEPVEPAPAPDTSVVIGRMFSDPYGGAIPAGTPVPVYDAATAPPPEPARKPGSREAAETAIDAARATPPATKPDTAPLFDEQLAAVARAKLRDARPSAAAARGEQPDDEDKGLAIYIRGTVPSEKLYLGGDQRLGRAYGTDGDPARACAMRRSGATWICPEAALWPAEVAGSFAKMHDGYVDSIVRYDDANARQFRVAFPSSNYERILAHFIERLGEPTGNPEIWSPVVGSAPQENRVARWVASEEDENGLAVLEVRSIDDLRWMMPPDPDNGVVRLFYKGAKPIYSMVTNADLRLLEVRRIAAGETGDDAVVR